VLASGSEVGLPVVSGVFWQRRCESEGERATTMAGSVRLAWCLSGRKPSVTMSVVMVAAPFGRRFSPARGTIAGEEYLGRLSGFW
jgi:hypothetical protein